MRNKVLSLQYYNAFFLGQCIIRRGQTLSRIVQLIISAHSSDCPSTLLADYPQKMRTNFAEIYWRSILVLIRNFKMIP